MTYIELPADGHDHIRVPLQKTDSKSDQIHLLSVMEIQAVNAAIAAGRPLLVRGEPGIGKSQFARAAAKKLKRAFVSCTIDAQMDARDLFSQFDAVRRLAEAQIMSASQSSVTDKLAETNFLAPGPMWWAFDWNSAEIQATRSGVSVPSQPDQGQWQKGTVLLIDEIDKAESEVPNGLLEALGARRFTPAYGLAPVVSTDPSPLLIFTTNEERSLPNAFLRRCLTLSLSLPIEREPQEAFLTVRGKVHFPDLDPTVIKKAAEMLFVDRQDAKRRNALPLPGQAEFLDLLRAVKEQVPDDPNRQLELLEVVRRFTLTKQPHGTSHS